MPGKESEMKKVYNYLGQELIDCEPEFAKASFSKFNEDGKVVPAWIEANELVDEQGFDRTNIEDNGEYKQIITLPKGVRLCRYGAQTGKTTAPIGTPYELMGLPFKKETLEYHEYEVIADGVFVQCIVTKGKAAAMFDSEGGAIQFVHQRRIVEELATNRLKEVTTWLENK